MNNIVFVGPMGGGAVPTNGASLKNFHLLKRLSEMGFKLKPVDTERWQKNPFVLLKLLFVVLFNLKSQIIIAANNKSTYRLLSIISFIPLHKDIIYWVIGGSIADWIKEGIVSDKPFKRVRLFIVEGDSMKRTLLECGFENVITIPNFKKIDYIPAKQSRGDVVKFVFLSRIVEQKGCSLIVKAAEELNKKYQGRFIIDFYGSVDKEYHYFNEAIQSLPNVNYKGFLDLRNTQNYDVLASYDVMLFPTFWHGEGFPGIMIDAFVCGLPVVASDWHMNRDILQEGKTGFFVKPQNMEELRDKMEYIITQPSRLDNMIINCQKEAMNYNTASVLNNKVLEGILKC